MRRTYEENLAAWERRRDARNEQIRKLGMPIDVPIRITVRVGWTLFGGLIVREWDAVVRENKHGWRAIRPLKRGGFRLDVRGAPNTWGAVRPVDVQKWKEIKA